MKWLIFLISLILLCQCSLMSRNIRARKLLSKCEYSLKELKIEDIDVGNFKLPFNYDYIKTKFKAKFQIHNVTSDVVAMDMLEADILVDGIKLSKLKTDKFLLVNPGEKKTTDIKFVITDEVIGIDFFNAKEIRVLGEVVLNLIVGKKRLDTGIKFKVDERFPFPKEKIKSTLENEVKRLKFKLKKTIKRGINKIKKTFK